MRPHPVDVLSLSEVREKVGAINLSKNIKIEFFTSQQDHEKNFHV
jgi:hypothetical protein